MSNAMNNLFANENTAATTNNRGLSGTAQLTNVAGNIAADILHKMNDNIGEYVEDIKTSQRDNNAMDALIERVHPLDDVDIEFLMELDEDTLEGMLKSQQSKRSRCKSKAMTMDNYKTLLTGAIAENLIRLATGKEKHSTGPRRMAGSVDYTIEQLQALSEDQEKLKKEIRNVQSKKSIMKSKADFDESDERYQALLRAEQQLKDMRISGSTVVEVDSTKNALVDLLAGKDLHNMKHADAKALLEEIANLTQANESMDAEAPAEYDSEEAAE